MGLPGFWVRQGLLADGSIRLIRQRSDTVSDRSPAVVEFPLGGVRKAGQSVSKKTAIDVMRRFLTQNGMLLTSVFRQMPRGVALAVVLRHSDFGFVVLEECLAPNGYTFATRWSEMFRPPGVAGAIQVLPDIRYFCPPFRKIPCDAAYNAIEFNFFSLAGRMIELLLSPPKKSGCLMDERKN